MKAQEVSVSIFGVQHNIDDATLISYINRLDLLRKNLGEQESVFLETSNLFQDVIQYCRDQKSALGNSSALLKIWDLLEDHFSFQKQQMSLLNSLKMIFKLFGQDSSVVQRVRLCEVSQELLASLLDICDSHQVERHFYGFVDQAVRVIKRSIIQEIY
jgi:hypothetical protein